MSNKFDEMTKGLAQSVTRRAALKKFGLGMAGLALAALGLANKAEAARAIRSCTTDADCRANEVCDYLWGGEGPKICRRKKVRGFP